MKNQFSSTANYTALENIALNSVDLALCYCGKEVCASAQSFGPEKRSEFLIHLVTDGKGYYSVGEEEYTITRGQLFLIYPDEITFYKADSDDPWSYAWIAFTGLKGPDIVRNCGFSRYNRVISTPHAKELYDVIQHILDARQLTYANDLKRQSYLFQFLVPLIENSQAVSSEHRTYDYNSNVYVNYALDYIETHYRRKLQIHEIADQIGLNRSHFTIIFKKKTGMSPQEYLLNYRLDKSCSLLKNTELPIKEISLMVSYEDSLAFSKIFKKNIGVSPRGYRTTEGKDDNNED